MGGSTIRQPIKPNHNRAVHKGVPTNLSEDKLLTEIGKPWKNFNQNAILPKWEVVQ